MLLSSHLFHIHRAHLISATCTAIQMSNDFFGAFITEHQYERKKDGSYDMYNDNSQSMKEHGRSLMIQGNYQDASKAFKDFLKKNSDDIEVQYLYTATRELKQPIKSTINFISVLGRDIYVHMGVTAPLGSTLIEVLRDVSKVCKETEHKIAHRFQVSIDGGKIEKIGGGFLMNWHVLDFKTIAVDLVNASTKPERFVLREIEREEYKYFFIVPPRAFLEHEPDEFRASFQLSFSDPPLDEVKYNPQNVLTSVLSQYNTITLLTPETSSMMSDTAVIIPSTIPELDIFFKKKGGSNPLAEALDKLIQYHIRSKARRDLDRQAPQEGAKRDSTENLCPHCNAKLSVSGLVRPDKSVICPKCFKRFTPENL
jgi:hypothetical protein